MVKVPQIHLREDLDLERSTLSDWVGGSRTMLPPLVQALGRYVLSACKIHIESAYEFRTRLA